MQVKFIFFLYYIVEKHFFITYFLIYITSCQQPKYKKHFKAFIALLALGLTITVYFSLSAHGSNGTVQRVPMDSLILNSVINGHFEDKLKLRGSVTPKTSIYLDIVAGGRVEEKLVEQGQYVIKGQPLLRLSNVTLQLDVMSREAQVTEQLNFLRNTQMAMTTNRLNLQRDLLEIDLKIGHLNRRIKQTKPLVSRGALAMDNLQTLELDLTYYQQRKKLTEQRQKQEEEIRHVQVIQLEESAEMLQKNLVFARDNLDNLLVRATAEGYLSELNVELGESKSRGARLGQIDIPNQFKLVASVDEYYLNHVTLNMPAFIAVNGKKVEVNVDKIDSRVRQAQFHIEFNMPKDLINIKRGQSLDVDLMLSKGVEDSLLVKRGAFVNSTGGNWVFVLNKDGTKAERRSIKLGKKNQNFYQVIQGLNIGERVITSNYSAFDKADTIQITGY